MKDRKIITEHVFPPIPDRRYDWRAVYEGMEEYPSTYGYGRTEEEAIAELKERNEDEDE